MSFGFARRPVVCLAFGSAVLLAAFVAYAQDQQTFHTGTNEVIVPVTVTTEKGQFVSDLDKGDFSVFDNGKQQTIDYFSRERNQPVVVGFILDLSNAVRSQWKDYQMAAEDLVYTLLPGDKKYSGYLIGYTTQADLIVNTTSDADDIVSKIRDMRPGGGAALYDALYEAITNRRLVQGEPYEPRRIIVIIGDGHDNASSKTLDQVLELAQRNWVTIYGVSTDAYGFGNDDADDNLLKLAIATGGKVEYPLENVYRDIAGYLQVPRDGGNYAYDLGTGGYQAARANNIFRAIANITGEITTQYILRYVPDIPANSKDIREIRVDVKLPNVKVRARQAYYPFPADGSPRSSR